MAYEEDFWQEKSRINWHINGDRNTEFFHKIAKIRNVTKKISIMKSGDRVLHSSDEIDSHILQYYMDLFSTDKVCLRLDFVDSVIPSIISDQDNTFLTNKPSLEEVKWAVFSMNANGAPGSDGFGGFFYHKYWHIIAQDVYMAVLQFFTQGRLPPNLNSNSVVLIPKINGAERIDQYRPITLANFKFKIVTKVLADRLAMEAPKVISENQRGFVKGRQITDCICIASESINLLDKRASGGQLAMKIDIKKAFDTV